MSKFNSTMSDFDDVRAMVDRAMALGFKISRIGEDNPEGYNQYKHDPFPKADDWTPETKVLQSVATHTFPGQFMKDTMGQKHYVKTAKDDEHLRVEHAAQQLAHMAGVPTAHTQLVTIGGKLHLASQVYEGSKHYGQPIPGMNAIDLPMHHEGVKRSLAAHAWLGNWDAAGKEYSNIIGTNEGPKFLDFGGSLHRRAQGGVKEFHAMLPTELGTLKNHPSNPAAKLFKHVSEDDIKQGVQRIGQVSNADIKHVIDKAGLPSHLADTLIKRKDAMVAEYMKPPHIHEPYGEHKHGAYVQYGSKMDAAKTHYHEGDATKLYGDVHGISSEDLGKEHVHHDLPIHAHPAQDNTSIVAPSHSGIAGLIPHQHPLTAVGSHSAAGFHDFDGITKALGANGPKAEWGHASTYHADQYYKHTQLLTQAEIKAGGNYGGSSSHFNEYFRNGGTLEHAGDAIKHLVSSINKNPGLEAPLVLKRGIGGSYGSKLQQTSKVGEEQIDPGFMGTSLTHNTPISMSGQKTLLVLNVPQGYPVGWIKYGDEREVILKPKTRYVVNKIESNGGMYKPHGFTGTVIYGTVLPHTEAMMLAAPKAEQALYKMPKWKSFPACPLGKPYCAGQYFDIPKHMYSYHVDKNQHVTLEKADELLKHDFAKKGAKVHTHTFTMWGTKPDGTYGQMSEDVEHAHDPALKGQVWIPKSHPAYAKFKYAQHKHEAEFHSHTEDMKPHVHQISGKGKYKQAMMKYEGSYGSITASHEHLPNGNVKPANTVFVTKKAKPKPHDDGTPESGPSVKF